MNCPHCGLPVSLVPALLGPLPSLSVEQAIESRPEPEDHTKAECRMAVSRIKQSRFAVFMRLDGQLEGITWAKTLNSRLCVQIGNYYLPVRRWADVVDVEGNPVLDGISE